MGYAPMIKNKAEEVIADLQVYGYRVWFDTGVMREEASYYDEIVRRIAQCEAYCCLITRDYYLSEYCMEEFRFAKEVLKKPVVTVFLDNFWNSLPDGMEEWLNSIGVYMGVDIRPVPEQIRASRFVENCRNRAGITAWEEAKKGDAVEFGRYEQGNGVVPIEWLVLDRSGSELFLISKYGLDCRWYQMKCQETIWAKSSLRLWLNSYFLHRAFLVSEQVRIRRSLCEAKPNPRYRSEPGTNSMDKIFLLSIEEAEKYFDSDTDRRCKPTPFAKQKADRNVRSDYCWWWLRSPGNGGDRAVIVENTGSISLSGRRVNDEHTVVRPALRLRLD